MPLAMPRLMPGDPLRISASTFVAWRRCPDQAGAQLRGIYGPDTRPAFVGSLAHRVFNRHLESGPIRREEFAQVCREEIGNSTLNYKMAGLEVKPSSLNGMIEEVRALYDRFVRLPTAGFEGSEVSLHHHAGEDVELVGKVDAVYREGQEGVRLVDWKTGGLGESKEQMGFYALLWSLTHGELPMCLEAISVKTGDVHRTQPTEATVEKVAGEIAEMVADLRTAWHEGGSLERRAGPWCRHCPVLDECSEGQAVGMLLD